jgi:hypothetical protein
MPYKDPERKRRWEREHVNKGMRRRTLQLAVSPSGFRYETSMSDPITDKRSDSGADLIPVLVIGFTFVGMLLVAGWRFSGILEPGGHS